MPIRLDERLGKIASLVEFGTVADIGCDHGKLGYYLVSTERASSVIATDISAPSLKKASELARENGVSELMQTRLGDGLKPVESEEADTVIIAGLGGDVISEILSGAREDGKCFDCFLLSPNTHAEKVRRELVLYEHTIVYDELIECGRKVYTVIKTRRGKCELDDMQIRFGAFYKTSQSFKKYAETELQSKMRIYLENPQSQTLATQIELLKAALGE